MAKIKSISYPRNFPNGDCCFEIEAEYQERNDLQIFITEVSFRFYMEEYDNLFIRIKIRDFDGCNKYELRFSQEESNEMVTYFDRDMQLLLDVLYWNAHLKMNPQTLLTIIERELKRRESK